MSTFTEDEAAHVERANASSTTPVVFCSRALAAALERRDSVIRACVQRQCRGVHVS